MKRVIIGLVLVIGLLSSNPSYAVDSAIFITPLENFDTATMIRNPSHDGKYEFILEDVLSKDELGYRSNIIMFMIDDNPYMRIFTSYSRLSNDGVQQKAVMKLEPSLLKKIAYSDVTALKVGGTKETILDDNFKQLLMIMLHNKNS